MKTTSRLAALFMAVIVSVGCRGQVVDVAQYAPIAFPWVYKATGQPTRSGWGRMGVSQLGGVAVMVPTAMLMKHYIRSQRPDGSDFRSMPSGHAAWSWLGATFVSAELGWRSPWYSIGACTFASAIGAQRVMSHRHWGADVAVGQLVGVGAGIVGYLVGDAIFRDRNMDSRYSPERGEAAVRSYFETRTGLMFNISSNKYWHRPAYTTGFSGGLHIADTGWALTAEAMLALITPEIGSDDRNVCREIDLSLMPAWSTAVSDRLLLAVKAGGGLNINAGSTGAVRGHGCHAKGQAGIQASLAITRSWSCSLEGAWHISRYSYSFMDNRHEAADNRLSLVLGSRINF